MSFSNSHTITDKELVSKVLEGNRQAFGVLVTQTEKLVAEIIFRLIPNTADHKDIAQDVYLKIYASLPRFRFQSKLSTYVGQVTYNTCLHFLEKKRPVLLDRFAENHDSDQFPQPGDTSENEAEARLFSKDLENVLHTALAQLPGLYQTIISLYHQQELSLLDIADITSLPVGTIKSYLFRARRQLKDILLKTYNKEEL